MRTYLGILISALFMMISSASHAALTCYGVLYSPTIAGFYMDNYGGQHSVGEQAWIMFDEESQSVFVLCSTDNNMNYLITQNSEANKYNAGKYSRFEWTDKSDQLYYCQQVYNADSADDAANFTKYPAANSSDPANDGCGLGSNNFPWSQLNFEEPITR